MCLPRHVVRVFMHTLIALRGCMVACLLYSKSIINRPALARYHFSEFVGAEVERQQQYEQHQQQAAKAKAAGQPVPMGPRPPSPQLNRCVTAPSHPFPAFPFGPCLTLHNATAAIWRGWRPWRAEWSRLCNSAATPGFWTAWTTPPTSPPPLATGMTAPPSPPLPLWPARTAATRACRRCENERCPSAKAAHSVAHTATPQPHSQSSPSPLIASNDFDAVVTRVAGLVGTLLVVRGT